jgi:hypothetical protein
MPKYEVLVPELHYQTVTVEAENEREAIKSIIDGGGDVVEGKLEYSCVMDDYLDDAFNYIENYDWMIQEVTNA